MLVASGSACCWDWTLLYLEKPPKNRWFSNKSTTVGLPIVTQACYVRRRTIHFPSNQDTAREMTSRQEFLELAVALEICAGHDVSPTDHKKYNSEAFCGVSTTSMDRCHRFTGFVSFHDMPSWTGSCGRRGHPGASWGSPVAKVMGLRFYLLDSLTFWVK